MKHNVGPLDRALRVLIGITLLAFAPVSDSPARWWGLLGLVPLLTAAIGYCPLYGVFGVSTCPRQASPR
jgi:Protein of unknown function (DUF2892)